MNKQPLSACLAEYTDKELIDFHANINALFLSCSEDFKLLPLLLQITFYLKERTGKICKEYMDKVEAYLNIPEEYKYSKKVK